MTTDVNEKPKRNYRKRKDVHGVKFVDPAGPVMLAGKNVKVLVDRDGDVHISTDKCLISVQKRGK